VVRHGDGTERIAVLHLAVDAVLSDFDALNAAFGNFGAEIGIGDHRPAFRAGVEHRHHDQECQEDAAPYEQALDPGIAVGLVVVHLRKNRPFARQCRVGRLNRKFA
jgi:hypothetical protein